MGGREFLRQVDERLDGTVSRSMHSGAPFDAGRTLHLARSRSLYELRHESHLTRVDKGGEGATAAASHLFVVLSKVPHSRPSVCQRARAPAILLYLLVHRVVRSTAAATGFRVKVESVGGGGGPEPRDPLRRVRGQKM